MNKKIYALLIILLSFAGTYAENGSNSPYSRYGIGLLVDQIHGQPDHIAGGGDEGQDDHSDDKGGASTDAPGFTGHRSPP